MNQKKVKPNKYSVAVNQMENFIKAGVNVPTEIPENEKDCFHVIIITEKKLNETTLEVAVKSRYQVFNDRSWNAVKKQLSAIGYKEVFLFHDPTIEVEVEEEKVVKKEPEENPELTKVFEEAKTMGYTGGTNVFEAIQFIAEAKARVLADEANQKFIDETFAKKAEQDQGATTTKPETDGSKGAEKTKKPTKDELIEEAVKLGYTGALNQKMEVYQKFIDEVKAKQQ